MSATVGEAGVTPGAMPPETVTEFVTEQIRDRIVLGTLLPGTKLSVYSLAEEFGVSRVPLREAVRQLEAESLVDNLARRGTVVRALKSKDVHDAFVMLNRVEELAAQRAASGPNGKPVVKEMRYWQDQMAALMAEGVPAASLQMLHAHRAFHFAMFKAGGEGGLLFRHLCMLWNTAERYVISSRTAERLEAAHREHEELMQRIEAGDVEGTAAALQAHIQEAWKGTRKFLESQGITDADEDLSDISI